MDGGRRQSKGDVSIEFELIKERMCIMCVRVHECVSVVLCCGRNCGHVWLPECSRVGFYIQECVQCVCVCVCVFTNALV